MTGLHEYEEQPAEHQVFQIKSLIHKVKRDISATAKAENELTDRELRHVIHERHHRDIQMVIDWIQRIHRTKVITTQNALDLTRLFGTFWIRGQGKNRDNRINLVSYFCGDDWKRYGKFFTLEQCVAIAAIVNDKPMTFTYQDKKYSPVEMAQALVETGDGDLVYEFQLAVIFGTKVISGINAG
ncbi:TPA: hypothetical protein ACJXXT_000242 [Pseudomonas aeruginosa]